MGRVVTIVLLCLLVLLVPALFRGEPARQPALSTPAGSDYYLLDARTRQYNKQGRLTYRIKAQRVLHYPDDSALLTGIRVAYPGEKGASWQLRADRGRVPSDSRDILLSGSVRLDYEAPDARPLILRTPQVWVRTQEQRAETDAPVVITGPGRAAHALGMTVFLDQKLLQLHHNVRVTYQELDL
ncbi:MAG: LPS export ABC transporter periplasmic protein LptC [Salinisphaera sp.]|nr:LPS export ABC transporter periplasmic protein LptC [Salinisphaera sp.]